MLVVLWFVEDCLHRERGDTSDSSNFGFIENKGHNYKCKGCWKVYCNECEAQKTFLRYQKCRNVYLRLWKQGRSVLQLTVAV